MRRSQQMLAAILDPAHRMSDFHGDRRDGDVLRHDSVLAAEAAADVGRDDPHLVFRKAEHPRQRHALDLAALGRQIDHQFVEPMIPIGEHAAAFERNRGLPIKPQPAAQPDRRRGERLRISLDDAGADVGVARPLIENARTVGAHGGNDIDDRRQLLELDTDLVGHILGLRPRRHHASCDRLPDVTDPLVGERRIGAMAMGGKFRPRFQHVDRADVGEREHLRGRLCGLDDVTHAAHAPSGCARRPRPGHPGHEHRR